MFTHTRDLNPKNGNPDRIVGTTWQSVDRHDTSVIGTRYPVDYDDWSGCPAEKWGTYGPSKEGCINNPVGARGEDKWQYVHDAVTHLWTKNHFDANSNWIPNDSPPPKPPERWASPGTITDAHPELTTFLWVGAPMIAVSLSANPVGGGVYSVDKVTVLSPWLLVIGLAGCIGTAVVVAKKRR